MITGEAMVLYGLRPKTHDIDLGCTSALADSLQADGYPVKIKENGLRHIRFNQDIELIENYLFDKVQLVEGFQVISKEGLLEMKKELGREKDQRDIALLEEALKK